MSDDRPDDTISPAETAGLRQRLAEQAAALRRQLAEAPAQEESLRADCLLDAADVGSSTEALAQHRTETDNARRLLARSEEALVRLDDGGFGNCVECGDAIGEERLHAFPHVEHCLRCASKKGGSPR